ncbi:MAG: magnesium/cobalt transporter CorA [Deltaproteobacteria bacterium]|nr:magnesium/cobalt transporter CorA [Deltaproteobacteria bacterium]
MAHKPAGALSCEGSQNHKEVKITVFDYHEKEFIEELVPTVEACAPFRDKASVTWINIDGLHSADVLESLSKAYQLHHLVIEDVLNVNERPKMESFDGYLYITARMLTYNNAKEAIEEEQVSMILGERFLITFQAEKEGDVFDVIRDRIRNNRGRIRKMGADYLTYSLLDAIVDHYFLILEKLGEKIVAVEEELTASPTPETLKAINKIKHHLVFLRKSIWPLRELVSAVIKTESPLISESAQVYFKDVYDHTIQTIDTIEAFRDTVTGMLDIYLSSVSYRLNEIMKVLTMIATIFMPLTFIVGIYGMNFNTASPLNMPELNWPFGYVLVLGMMVIVFAGMMIFFRRKKWF